MSTTTDGWTRVLSRWREVSYEHDEDGSQIARMESPLDRSKPFGLYFGDPPRLWSMYPTVEAAKAGHAEETADQAEARELQRSKP